MRSGPGDEFQIKLVWDLKLAMTSCATKTCGGSLICSDLMSVIFVTFALIETNL